MSGDLFFKILFYIVEFFVRVGSFISHLFARAAAPVKHYYHRVRVKRIMGHTEHLVTHRHPSRYKHLSWNIRWLVAFFVGIAVLIAVTLFYSFVQTLPDPHDIGKVNYALSSHIYDRNGVPLFKIYRDQNRSPVNLSDLPPHVINSTIAIEDKDFYHHLGIAPVSGIARAVKETFLDKEGVQGGSTITQQLVKTALLTPERTFSRKMKEIILALYAERIYNKQQILEMYLNQVPYGGPVYGIGEASRTYFGKQANQLTISEAALLAGLPQAPTVYSPFSSSASAILRRNQVLRAMHDQRYITDTEYDTALREKMNIRPPDVSLLAPHFVFYVKDILSQRYGTNVVEKGGLHVITTLDMEVQRKAEQILREELEKVKYLNITNGAILVTRPKTGEILAMVGSVDYGTGNFGAYNATTAQRQPGSSIKPIVYSLALQRGYTAATIIDDVPTTFFIGPTEVYRPVNYDGKFHGRIPLRFALANSYNIPAVKVLASLGVVQFIDYAKKAGIDTWIDPSHYGISLALGGGEVRMTDMAEAFGSLANNGVRHDLQPFAHIVDVYGTKIEVPPQEEERVMDPSVAYIMSEILSDNNARVQAFGPGSQLEIAGHRVAVKTGTTNDKKDNWTIGYTPDYLVAVWVGNNDNTPMNPYLTSGITGAAPIWHRVMEYMIKDKGKDAKVWYQAPANVVQKQCYGRVESFIAGTEKSTNCVFPTAAPSPTPVP